MDIDDKKVDIGLEKVDIENIIREKGLNFSTKTIVYIHELFNEFNIDIKLGRSDVMKITGLKPLGFSKLISNLLSVDIIEPVKGHDKGKYKIMI